MKFQFSAAVLLLALWIPACVHSDQTEEVTPDTESVDLVLMSYNIKHGRGMDGTIDLERTARVIEKQHPDIVALQEVDFECRRSAGVDTAKWLAKRLKMEYRFGEFMDYQGGKYGMAILSRFPIKSSTRHVLPTGAEPRCALETVVGLPEMNTDLRFVGIHNDWTEEEIRIRQVKALVDALGESSIPTFLVGDFNGTQVDQSLQILRTQGFRIHGSGLPTFPSQNPEEEIDFFLSRALDIRQETHKVIKEEIASDHRPIVLRMTLNAKTPPAQ